MIVLFTDFDLAGPYTGQVKAVLTREAPGVPVASPGPAPPAPKSQRNAGKVDGGGAEAKPKRRRTPRSRTAVTIDKGAPAASAPNTGAAEPSPAAANTHFEPEVASIFGLPRESLDELILGYIAQPIE